MMIVKLAALSVDCTCSDTAEVVEVIVVVFRKASAVTYAGGGSPVVFIALVIMPIVTVDLSLSSSTSCWFNFEVSALEATGSLWRASTDDTMAAAFPGVVRTVTLKRTVENAEREREVDKRLEISPMVT